MGNTVEAHHGTALSVKILTHNIHTVIAIEIANIMNPVNVIIRRGVTENEVIASIVNAII